MDPAPGSDSTITMPSATRLVSRSVGLLTGYSFTDYEALQLVRSAARHAWADLRSVGLENLGWLEDIWREADRRLGATPPPTPTTEDERHGGETSPDHGSRGTQTGSEG